jgi:secondary thiamine-phosphate synthase enzyme
VPAWFGPTALSLVHAAARPYRARPRAATLGGCVSFTVRGVENVAWLQREIQLPAFGQGCHSIGRELVAALPELDQFKIGLLHVFIQHTSASLTLNENADPDVPVDLQRGLDALAPEKFPYRHTIEGPDDMPAHLKVSLTDSSVSIPVRNGRLLLGTWQGVFLWEHRRHGGHRRLVLTLQGET